MTLIIRGLILGFSIAMPVGPIGLLCIRRSLARGGVSGFLSGLGAATADALYGSVAAFGLTAVAGVLMEQLFLLRLVGGAFLCYLGIRAISSKPPPRQVPTNKRGLIGDYVSTLLLTLANPATILSFAAVFAGAGLAAVPSDFAGAAMMVVGVFLGSAAWWLVLSSGTALMRRRLTSGILRGINVLSGLIILGMGIAFLVIALMDGGVLAR